MISQEQNELLTRTGPGTPMGTLFRRYWIPALLAEELPEADCPPVRVGLLSEKLVAFRDSQGRLGLVSEFCPHRGVSLWFGRNEESGIRCTYHGWKFDVTGQCIEIPSEESDSTYCSRIKLTSYPCIERGGVIWTYMGPPELKPEEPAFEWVSLPASHRFLSKRWQESNYLQAIEGGIDSSHVSFLHRGDLDSDPLHKNTQGAKFAKSTKTKFECLESDAGLVIGARRQAEKDSFYWRVSQWLMPWYTLIPPYAGHALNGHAWVPIDDENCIAWTFTFHPVRPISDEEARVMRAGAGVHVDLIPGTFRPVANRSNDYLIDRAAQKAGKYYNGVRGLSIQDASVQESMGAITDRTTEHLVSTDAAIILARRILTKAAKAAEAGDPVPGLTTASQQVRSASFILSGDANFADKALDSIQVRAGMEHIAV